MTGLRVDFRPREGSPVAFDAPPGTILALLGGPSARRAAVLDAIAGLGSDASGRIVLDDSPTTAHRTGALLQPMILFPELTAAENIVVPLLARGRTVDPHRIDQVLESLALPPATRDNLVEQLSGGQQQRVGIARALITGSPLLCLNEPLSELDEATVDAVWTTLQAEAARGTVIVIATIDRALAARCDRTVTLSSA